MCRTRAASVILALIPGFVISCAGVPRYVNPETPPAIPLLLWVEDHPRLPPADALEGCRIWAQKGIACAIVQDEEAAVLRIYAEDICEEDADGRKTLATAYPGGRVVMRTACFMKRGKFDHHAYRAVVGHEVGHELGIWTHVPDKCGRIFRSVPEDKRICGHALMNPLYDEDVFFMTPVDALAFNVRLLEYAVADHDGTAHSDETDPDKPRCVYRTRPE